VALVAGWRAALAFGLGLELGGFAFRQMAAGPFQPGLAQHGRWIAAGSLAGRLEAALLPTAAKAVWRLTRLFHTAGDGSVSQCFAISALVRPCSGAGCSIQGHGRWASWLLMMLLCLLGLCWMGQLGRFHPSGAERRRGGSLHARVACWRLSGKEPVLSPVSVTGGFGSSPPCGDLPDWAVTAALLVLLAARPGQRAFAAQVVIADLSKSHR